MAPAETNDGVPDDFGPDTRENFHTLKYRNAFAVFSATGCMNGPENDVPEINCKDGLFVGDTRVLSRLILRLNQVPVTPLGAVVSEGGAVFTASLANRQLHDSKGRSVPPYSIHADRERFLRNSLHDRFRITNYSGDEIDLDVTLDCWADFRDIFEVRGATRARRGNLHAPRIGDRSLQFSYQTLDGIELCTTIEFARDADIHGGKAHFRLRLAPGETESIGSAVHVEAKGSDVYSVPPRDLLSEFESCRTKTIAEYRARRGHIDVIHTNRPAFDEWLARSASDLALLITDLETGPYPFAGLPWFAAPFGRDAIITAMQVSWLYPELARGVLDFLAATQADTVDPPNESAPGKILHEARNGEMARCGEVPFHRYYGGIDQTLLFVMLAEEYYRRVADLEWLKRFRPSLDHALAWADYDGDRDGDGLIEYVRSGDRGLINQGWKDSGNAVFHADGQLAQGPIALVEVQAYHYAARHSAAALYRALGDEGAAARADEKAEFIRGALDSRFWSDDLGAWVLGLDGQKEPMQVLTSNAGHVLFAGATNEARARAFAEQSASDDFVVQWGMRTVAEGAVRFNPMGYHNGSIWPHDNSLVAAGLCRYGEKTRAARLASGLFAAAHDVQNAGLPELYCGFGSAAMPHLVSYPSACSPQAWAAGSPFLCLKALIGLQIDMTRDREEDRIKLCDPHLPPDLDWLRINGLKVGDRRATIRVERIGESSCGGSIEIS